MSFKSGFESRERESRSLTQQVAVSSKSEVRQCWTIVWQMLSLSHFRLTSAVLQVFCRRKAEVVSRKVAERLRLGCGLCCSFAVFAVLCSCGTAKTTAARTAVVRNGSQCCYWSWKSWFLFTHNIHIFQFRKFCHGVDPCSNCTFCIELQSKRPVPLPDPPQKSVWARAVSALPFAPAGPCWGALTRSAEFLELKIDA